MDRFIAEIQCDNNANPSVTWGSIMHGMLMEALPAPWPEKLHGEGWRPFSQWVEAKGSDCLIWHIGVLDDELGDAIDSILRPDIKYKSMHLNAEMTVRSAKRLHQTSNEYMTPFFTSDEACSGVTMHYLSPTTHKSQKHYAVFPSVELIAKNLAGRFCNMAPDFALSDHEALEQVISHTRISRFRLESLRYSLEGTWITGYTGWLELKFSGPDPLKRLAGVLFTFAEWSGIGIKTALGMGGCTVSPLIAKHKAYDNNPTTTFSETKK